ncbi:MAG: carboxylesterase family protein [Muribaculaceae bacterium]|nr:carboxylesterase family protein [Muribaculaceae bacterium]
MKRLFAAVFAAMAWLMLPAQNHYTTREDISYTDKNDEYSAQKLKLDVHFDTEGNDLPVIVWFHGGGLTGGNKFIPAELSEQGYVVVAPNYRLVPGVEVEDCIDDAAEAVAWTFRNIRDFGGDPSKIFVAGHSAGGFLTSMIGLDKSRLAKYDIDADSIAGLIPYSGQVITHFSDRKSKGIGELTPYIDPAAPLFHVRKDCAPYVIITGDAEEELYGRYEENLYMWRMMKLVGHPDVKIYKLDGYNHVDMARPAHHILKNEISRILKKQAVVTN